MHTHKSFICSLMTGALLSFLIWVPGVTYAETTLTLEKPIHVTTAEGSDAVLEAGEYVVEPAQEWLRITLSGESPATALLLETQVGRHEEQLDEPLVFVAEGETGDAYHVVLLLLNGKKYESIGSTSGLRTRGSRPFLSTSVLEAAARHAKKGPELTNLKVRPAIENTILVEGSIGLAAPGILAPKGRLYIKGRSFGQQKGELFLKVKASDFPEYPSGIVPLEDLNWTNDKINGRIPKGMTGPIFRANVNLYVRRVDGAISNGFPRQFEVPVETRMLKRTDPEVRVIFCGVSLYATNNSVCQSSTWSSATLNGRHFNGWGSDPLCCYDYDEYAIHLQDGWVFSRSEFKKTVTGNDGDFVKPPKPALPVGKTSWVPKVEFWTSSDDKVTYSIDIEVKRAKGAY
ncbi:MAG: hypothetical protein KC594_17320 [Nitrospira sp.]|nr:hypothetical protein [Nitrospira sp.]